MNGKKPTFFQFTKKNSKQLAHNYLPVSLLPIFSKFFQKLIFDDIFSFMEQNNLFNNNRAGFKPNDSCINQLISITHSIFWAFDANPSLVNRGVLAFCAYRKYLKKSFTTVCFTNFFTNSNSLCLIKSFLQNQIVFLNGQSLIWKPISAEVPPGTVICPLLLLVYIMEISPCLYQLFTARTKVWLQTLDWQYFVISVVNCVNTSALTCHNDVMVMQNWVCQWKMSFSPDKKQASENKLITQPPFFFNSR